MLLKSLITPPSFTQFSCGAIKKLCLIIIILYSSCVTKNELFALSFLVYNKISLVHNRCLSGVSIVIYLVGVCGKLVISLDGINVMSEMCV